MKPLTRSFFLLAAAILMTPVSVAARNTMGTISGRITDQSSAVVPGVTITVSNDATGLSRTATTNHDGEYVIPFLPIGSYTVRAKKDGFKSQTAPNLRLEILQVRKVDFTLEVGDVSQTVEVTSNAPLVETETSNAGQVIKNEQVARLPLNVRQFLQLSFLAPMAAPAAADFRSTEINRDTAVPAGAGQRPEQNNYQIDGVDNKENGRNSFAVSPPVDKDTVYGRYIFNQEKSRTPPNLPAPANSGGRDFILRAQTASAQWNHVFSPTLINNATLGYTRYRNRLGTLNSFVKNPLTPSGITNTLADVDPLFWAAPSVGIPGFLMPNENTPNYRTTNNYQLQDSLLWSRTNHTIKIGGDLKDVREYMFFTGGNGSTTFANRYTGNNVADFLLGLPSNVNKTARASEWNSRVQYLEAGNEGLGFDPRTGEVLISQNIRNRARIEDFYKNVRQDIRQVSGNKSAA